MNTRRWAEDLLAAQPTTALRLLADDPLGALRNHFGIEATPAKSFAERGEGGICDGISIIDNNLILYRETLSRRQNFTLCHEFGHYIIDSDDDCLEWCLGHSEPGRTIEMLADAIAALVLIPASRRDQIIRPPTAAAVFELFHNTSASRSACLNVLVDLLPSEGFGILIDRYEPEIVFYAARKSETRPYPWKGDELPAGNRVRRIDDHARGRSNWPYPDGIERNFYLDAATDDDWTVALFSDNNIWDIAGVSFVDLDDRQRYDGDVACKNKGCGYKGPTSYFPCNTCGQPTCPRCNECQCDTDARITVRAKCAVCTATVRAELLDQNRVCSGCR